MDNELFSVLILVTSKTGLMLGLPRWFGPANGGDRRDAGSTPGSGRSPGKGQSTPVRLPGEPHGQRSLETTVRGVTESDMTEVTERAVNLLRLFHLEHFSKDGTCTKF